MVAGAGRPKLSPLQGAVLDSPGPMHQSDNHSVTTEKVSQSHNQNIFRCGAANKRRETLWQWVRPAAASRTPVEEEGGRKFGRAGPLAVTPPSSEKGEKEPVLLRVPATE